jgi:hypothetical protein
MEYKRRGCKAPWIPNLRNKWSTSPSTHRFSLLRWGEEDVLEIPPNRVAWNLALKLPYHATWNSSFYLSSLVAWNAFRDHLVLQLKMNFLTTHIAASNTLFRLKQTAELIFSGKHIFHLKLHFFDTKNSVHHFWFPKAPIKTLTFSVLMLYLLGYKRWRRQQANRPEIVKNILMVLKNQKQNM